LLRLLRVSGALCVALRRGEEIIGVQIAGYRNRPEPFTTPQQRIAQGISQIASLALVNAQLLEGLEQANRLKSDFLATISHELRTPLNIIIGYTQLVLDETEENTGDGFAAKHVGMLQRVDRSARELLDLITALLDVSRLEAGQRLLDVREIRLQELLEEIEAETGELLRGKPGLHLVWPLKTALPPLQTDRAKLKVVLKNLVGNAVKFTQQGQVMINVAANNGEVEGEVEFCVIDTGVGIAPEVLPVIFEMFRQGDSSATRRLEGVGLGLYIVKRLVELLGGRIEVESEVGHGSTFRVWIPTITQPAKLL
jgi:signal transduction histidine kinase